MFYSSLFALVWGGKGCNEGSWDVAFFATMPAIKLVRWLEKISFWKGIMRVHTGRAWAALPGVEVVIFQAEGEVCGKEWANCVHNRGKAPSSNELRDTEIFTWGELRKDKKTKIYATTKRQSEPHWQTMNTASAGGNYGTDLLKNKLRKMRARYKGQRWMGLTKDWKKLRRRKFITRLNKDSCWLQGFGTMWRTAALDMSGGKQGWRK